MPEHWRAIAAREIDSRIAEARALGLSGAALESYVRERYPFSLRSGHAYRAWCAGLSEVFGHRAVQGKGGNDDEGQWERSCWSACYHARPRCAYREPGPGGADCKCKSLREDTISMLERTSQRQRLERSKICST
jgi:hypothetical protein